MGDCFSCTAAFLVWAAVRDGEAPVVMPADTMYNGTGFCRGHIKVTDSPAPQPAKSPLIVPQLASPPDFHGQR
jgi:hypothetical protein